MRAMMTRDSGLLRTASQDLQDRPGVYCIFNSESEMMYIGCSNSIKTRIYTHKRHLSNGEHVCKQMSADFVRNPDSFVFFYIEYVDYSDYGTLEFHRSVLLNRETQYMKRVPHLRLYNNNVPVSLSEKMLIGDTPKDLIKIHVSDIFRRLEMSPDSIRANGLTIQDEMTIGEAIKFVRKRTVASGRWPQEKASLAIGYLTELEAQMGSGLDSESALRASGDFDYFGEYVVRVDLPDAAKSLPARPKIGWRECIIVGLLIAPTAASVRNMYTVTYHLSEHATDAVLLTTVLSVSALGFVAAGIRSWWAVALAVVLILFESFCNLARIYGGLMGTGTTGNPTRFLGLVCDIFASGSHWTAVVLGGITALFLAAVQYAAIFELNKTSA